MVMIMMSTALAVGSERSARDSLHRHLAYQRIFPKNPLPSLGELDIQHRSFPADIAARHLYIHGPSNDLMSKAHADNAHARLREDRLGILDQP